MCELYDGNTYSVALKIIFKRLFFIKHHEALAY